ncbi:uncharacterized protein LOC131874064 [Cryptomeria japonica]|uniref:uncharacterized protein LOC131874064 n=1 Tax=Cryptomeria japonica TaxID=3369 RepID=UPI0027DA142F|nr:uncharacterized protein LOC131874064 [Cryptomeria japonica]
MAYSQEGASLSRAPLFDGTDYVFWKIRMETYLISVDVNVWNIVITKYVVPNAIPSDPEAKSQYELNARAKHALLCGLTKDVFVKVMHCASAHEIWSKLETIYQGSNPSSSKETAFKVEKKEELDSESELSDAIEALLKKTSLFIKEDSENDSDDSPCEGDETLFMAAIETSSKKDLNNISVDQSDDLDQGEIDLEGELLCALKEIKRFKKLVASHESEKHILQIELKDSKQIVEDLKVLLADSELKVNILEQQSSSLHKQIEQYESTLHLNEILSKQKQCKNLTGIGFDSAESSKQITKLANKKQFQAYNRMTPFRFGFFHGYYFYCNKFGHKVNTCRFLQHRTSMFGHNQASGFPNTVKCIKCNFFGHTSSQCKSKEKIHKVWKPKFVPSSEQSMIVQTAFLSSKKSLWVLDSGCSHHMTGDRNKFLHFENFDGGFVRFGDNSGAFVRGKGTLLLNDDTPIHDVYFVEGLKHNLLSVSQICDSGYNVSFSSQGCAIKNKSGKIVATGLRTIGNVYNLLDSTDYENNVGMCLMGQVEENWLWHKRLGHVNFDNLVRISKNQNVRGLPILSKPLNIVCKECLKGKQTKVSFKSKEHSSSSPLQLVHTDLCGPTRTQSINGEKYFMLFVDDYTRMYAAARTPQQNGVVERKNRTVKEMARTMLNEANLPDRYWKEAVHTTVYILNRVQIRDVEEDIPIRLEQVSKSAEA